MFGVPLVLPRVYRRAAVSLVLPSASMLIGVYSPCGSGSSSSEIEFMQ
jgi:hypothetical protein